MHEGERERESENEIINAYDENVLRYKRAGKQAVKHNIAGRRLEDDFATEDEEEEQSRSSRGRHRASH